MKATKRFLSCILVLILVLSVMAVAVSADGTYTPANSYVLNYNGVYAGPKWQYFSPYIPSWRYEGSFDYNNTIAFSLYNTASGEPLVAYCTDIDTGLASNSYFRRINLEDSTYAASAAGLLRSVYLNGFPNTSLEELGQAAGVENLTMGEAVNATQLAIWKAAHGSSLNYSDFVYKFDTEWNETATQHYAECYQEIADGYAVEANEELITSHIEAVYNYLISLAPTAPREIAVSNASFTSWSEAPVLTPAAEEGCYDITVGATVNVMIKSGDAMTLSAVVGNGSYYTSTALSNGSNTYELTIPNVPADIAHGDVMLAIDGTQTASDVFLFDAIGDRGTSQSLIAADSSQLPVHAEVVVETPRVINIHKTTGSGLSLEGIHFDVYYKGSREAYLNNELTLDYAYYGQADFTMVTDAQGNASLNLSQHGMGDGVYLIVERKHPAIVAPVKPFYVIMPMTSADGTTLIYEININPKNEVRGGPQIEKDVITLGNDFSSEDVCDAFTWIISADIPVDIAQGKSYVIADTLDPRLNLMADSIRVQVEPNDGATAEMPAVALTEGVDYKLTVTDGAESDAFAISLTPSGMLRIAGAAGDVDAYKLRVYFDTEINTNAAMGEEIPNQATLNYRNSVGVGFEDESDVPEVVTGGATLLKVTEDSPETVLPGAEFQVYRHATTEELNAGAGIDVSGINGKVVPVAFYDTPDLSGEKVTAVTSDENGIAYIFGLAYGDYYVVETKAPAGYNRLAEPQKIVVNETSHQDGAEVRILNKAGTVLPETGGPGVAMFAILGIACLILGGGALLFRKRLFD